MVSRHVAAQVVAEAGDFGQQVSEKFVELIPEFLADHKIRPAEMKALLVAFVVVYKRASESFDDTFPS